MYPFTLEASKRPHQPFDDDIAKQASWHRTFHCPLNCSCSRSGRLGQISLDRDFRLHAEILDNCSVLQKHLGGLCRHLTYQQLPFLDGAGGNQHQQLATFSNVFQFQATVCLHWPICVCRNSRHVHGVNQRHKDPLAIDESSTTQGCSKALKELLPKLIGVDFVSLASATEPCVRTRGEPLHFLFHLCILQLSHLRCSAYLCLRLLQLKISC